MQGSIPELRRKLGRVSKFNLKSLMNGVYRHISINAGSMDHLARKGFSLTLQFNNFANGLMFSKNFLKLATVWMTDLRKWIMVFISSVHEVHSRCSG